MKSLLEGFLVSIVGKSKFFVLKTPTAPIEGFD